MGSRLELNDVLQLTTDQGFPAAVLDLAVHQRQPIPTSSVSGTVFAFARKPNARFFQSDPAPVRLVHNIGGKWLFWGRALIQSQSITKTLNPDGSWTTDSWETAGTYQIVDLYEPVYQKLFTLREAPAGLSYFPPEP